MSINTNNYQALDSNDKFHKKLSPRHFDAAMTVEMQQVDMDLERATSGVKVVEEPVEDTSISISLAVNTSWAVNWFLLGAKAYLYFISSSKAVLAALVDSAVDLVSQAVLALAETYMSRFSPDYPVGRSRLEALSVICCAFIMSTASLEGKYF